MYFCMSKMSDSCFPSSLERKSMDSMTMTGISYYLNKMLAAVKHSQVIYRPIILVFQGTAHRRIGRATQSHSDSAELLLHTVNVKLKANPIDNKILGGHTYRTANLSRESGKVYKSVCTNGEILSMGHISV